MDDFIAGMVRIGAEDNESADAAGTRRIAPIPPLGPYRPAIAAELRAIADDLHWKHCDDTFWGSEYAYRHENDPTDEAIIARIRAIATHLEE